jgi:hypothetical protein
MMWDWYFYFLLELIVMFGLNYLWRLKIRKYLVLYGSEWPSKIAYGGSLAPNHLLTNPNFL